LADRDRVEGRDEQRHTQADDGDRCAGSNEADAAFGNGGAVSRNNRGLGACDTHFYEGHHKWWPSSCRQPGGISATDGQRFVEADVIVIRAMAGPRTGPSEDARRASDETSENMAGRRKTLRHDKESPHVRRKPASPVDKS
jgi:hypothetical protein